MTPELMERIELIGQRLQDALFESGALPCAAVLALDLGDGYSLELSSDGVADESGTLTWDVRGSRKQDDQ